MQRVGREHLPKSGPAAARVEPPQLPRPVRDRHARAPAGLLLRQARAVREALAGLGAQRARRVPSRPWRGRPRGGGHGARDPRARRLRRAVPGGHARPQRPARLATARRRPPGAGERRAGRANRGARLRTRPSRLADPPAQGAPARRAPDELPDDRQLVTGARRGCDRSDLGLRELAVGVARRRARGGGARLQVSTEPARGAEAAETHGRRTPTTFVRESERERSLAGERRDAAGDATTDAPSRGGVRAA